MTNSKAKPKSKAKSKAKYNYGIRCITLSAMTEIKERRTGLKFGEGTQTARIALFAGHKPKRIENVNHYIVDPNDKEYFGLVHQDPKTGTKKVCLPFAHAKSYFSLYSAGLHASKRLLKGSTDHRKISAELNKQYHFNPTMTRNLDWKCKHLAATRAIFELCAILDQIKAGVATLQHVESYQNLDNNLYTGRELRKEAVDRCQDLAKDLKKVEQRVKKLESSKADKTEVQNMRKQVQELQKQLSGLRKEKADKTQIQELQEQLKELHNILEKVANASQRRTAHFGQPSNAAENEPEPISNLVKRVAEPSGNQAEDKSSETAKVLFEDDEESNPQPVGNIRMRVAQPNGDQAEHNPAKTMEVELQDDKENTLSPFPMSTTLNRSNGINVANSDTLRVSKLKGQAHAYLKDIAPSFDDDDDGDGLLSSTSANTRAAAPSGRELSKKLAGLGATWKKMIGRK